MEGAPPVGQTSAVARIGFVSSPCGWARRSDRHAGKHHNGDRRNRSRVDCVQPLAGTLDEGLSGGIRRDDTVVSIRLMSRDLAGLDDNNGATRVGMPARLAAGGNCVLHNDNI
jgi:hypothetical protein